jgi:hypothetical protein
MKLLLAGWQVPHVRPLPLNVFSLAGVVSSGGDAGANARHRSGRWLRALGLGHQIRDERGARRWRSRFREQDSVSAAVEQ